MRYMLDTNILIYLLKNKPPSVAQRMDALADSDEICMSFVTYAELLKGARKSTQRASVEQRIDALTRIIEVDHDAGAEVCAAYAQIAHELQTKGQLIGGNDLWIAAHALAGGCVLVTNNLREFKRVKGLALENWAA